MLPAHTTYEDGTECSETSAHKIQTPGNRPKERIQQLLNSFLFLCQLTKDIVLKSVIEQVSQKKMKVSKRSKAESLVIE
jgi:hypothetical protein